MLLVVTYFVHSDDAACERKAQKIHVRCSLEDIEKGRGPSWARVLRRGRVRMRMRFGCSLTMSQGLGMRWG